MRVDDIVRSERHFTSGLLLNLLLINDFEGVQRLLSLLTSRRIIPPGVIAGPVASDAIQVIAELAIRRDLLRYLEYPKVPIVQHPAPESDVPRDVIDVVVIVGGLLIAIEGKFFSPTHIGAIREQLKTQRKAIRFLEQHPDAGITRVCQVLLTADPTVDIGQLRPTIPPDTDAGVITWADITDMAEKLLGLDAYVTLRLRSALDRYAKEFAGGESGQNWAGIEELDPVLQRCRKDGAQVVIGYAGGEAALRERPWLELVERRFKWDWANGGTGKKLWKNWIPGNRFASVIAELRNREHNSTGQAEPAVPINEQSITHARMDELLAYLPLFGVPDERWEPEWHGGTEHPTQRGVITMPHPAYPPEVEAFFRLAGQPWWCNHGYNSDHVRAVVQNDEFIASASLAQIKGMLTYCVRGERFSDGHWGAMVREGRIGAILRRLRQIRDGMTGGQSSVDS
jgi:hypothetical protein